MSDLFLNLFVSDKIAALAEGNIKQLQATVPHENVVELLELAGLPESTQLSRKKGTMLDVTITTPKGSEVTLRQGDTHAYWYGHQDNDDARKILSYAKAKGAVSFPVKDVKVVEATQKSRPVSADDLDDCPV